MDGLDRSLDDIIKAKKPTGGSARGGKGGRGAGRGGKVTGPTGGRGARGTALGVRGGGRGGGRGGRGGSSRAIAKPVRAIAVPARQQQQVHMPGERGYVVAQGRRRTRINSTTRMCTPVAPPAASARVDRVDHPQKAWTLRGWCRFVTGRRDCTVWWGDAHHRAGMSFDAPAPHAHVCDAGVRR